MDGTGGGGGGGELALSCRTSATNEPYIPIRGLVIPIVKQPGGWNRAGKKRQAKEDPMKETSRSLYLLVFPHSSGDHGTRDSERKGEPTQVFRRNPARFMLE